MTFSELNKQISKRLDIDLEIVETVTKHVFSEVENIMKDEGNTSDILFNELFKFKLKSRYKQNKTNKYSSK
jgi:nucleoid DNA-binding protein